MKKTSDKKIILCGPPHSGKSVFAANLLKKLPTEYTYLFRACPDGEGNWSNNEDQHMTQLVRNKGEFNKEFVQECIKVIENVSLPILLVDVGGIRSKENEEIFKCCDNFIILSNQDEEIQKWQEFGEKAGLECIGKFKSDLNEKEDIIYQDSTNDCLEGVIVNLERGKDLDSEIINNISDRIVENTYLEKNLKSNENIIDMNEIARELNMISNDGKIFYDNKRIREIASVVSSKINSSEDLKVTGSRANWLSGHLLSVFKEKEIEKISFFDISTDKYVDVEKLEKNDEKSRNSEYIYSSFEENEESILIDFELLKYRINPEDIEKISIPNIDSNKKLYISGKLPNWLFTSISNSYENNDKSVFQPGQGFFKYSSQNDLDLGILEKEPIGIDVEKFFKEKQENKNLSQLKSQKDILKEKLKQSKELLNEMSNEKIK